jgi:hypothetical protein
MSIASLIDIFQKLSFRYRQCGANIPANMEVLKYFTRDIDLSGPGYVPNRL